MSEYIFDHSQCSPVGTTLYVDHIGDRKMYQLYRQETDEKNKTHVKEGTFYKLWQQVIDAGVTDPETCVEYEVLIRKARAKGFKKCNVCSYYEMLIRGTSDVSKRAVYERKYQAHIKEVYADREELARIQRLCIVNPNHCGFFLDAADSQKFSLPTTMSTAKMLSQLWRIKQKLTCVQMFDARKSLYFYRSLPDVPTGGNLTCTIIMDMFTQSMMGPVTDVHINVDGSGDNICYTLVYTVVHLLLCAHTKKWRLRRIHLLRMKVGHTHNDLDATFGVLSRHVFGKHARGDPRQDILSFKSFEEVPTCLHHRHTYYALANLIVSLARHVAPFMETGLCNSRISKLSTILIRLSRTIVQKRQTLVCKNILLSTSNYEMLMVTRAYLRAPRKP